MQRKVRTTGCARFFMVLIVLIPLAFIGASLYQGKNPHQAFGALFGKQSTEEEKPASNNNSSDEVSVEALQQKIDSLEKELKDCKNK